jgi:hypothetical protein
MGFPMLRPIVQCINKYLVDVRNVDGLVLMLAKCE